MATWQGSLPQAAENAAYIDVTQEKAGMLVVFGEVMECWPPYSTVVEVDRAWSTLGG
jgi:hypothetical protein